MRADTSDWEKPSVEVSAASAGVQWGGSLSEGVQAAGGVWCKRWGR